MCNKEIKFGLFLEKALSMGADFVATGHYVRIKKTAKGYALFEAKDKNKDQSYFLWTLTQKQLAHCLFPIGNLVKPKVRSIAKQAGLPTAEKKDSQGICFLGKITIADFLKQYIPEKTGALVTTTGDKIGEHSGAEFYTIGQRHLGVGYRVSKTAENQKPFYVASKDAKTNTVIVAQGSDHEALYKKELSVVSVNIIIPNSQFQISKKIFARVRYRQPLSQAHIEYRVAKNKKSINEASMVFTSPQKFVASGQSVVWYSKQGEMLGGGVIV
jgi:tRNA-specific 2-thiouridylase